MINKKSGSEKLLNDDTSLCQLTAEELELVAGGLSYIGRPFSIDYFPLGTINPDVFRKLSRVNQQLDQIGPVDIGNGLGGHNISNGL